VPLRAEWPLAFASPRRRVACAISAATGCRFVLYFLCTVCLDLYALMVKGFYAWMVAGVIYRVDSTDVVVWIIFRSRYARKSSSLQHSFGAMALFFVFVCDVFAVFSSNSRASASTAAVMKMGESLPGIKATFFGVYNPDWDWHLHSVFCV